MKEKPETYMFEYALSHWFSTTRKRSYMFSNHRAKLLEAAGYVKFSHEKRHEYPDKPHENWSKLHYVPTPAGIQWWAEERVRLAQEGFEKFPDWGRRPDAADLAETFFGKGIGGEIRLYVGMGWGGPAYDALRRGFVEFVSHYDYYPRARGPEEYLTVRLTKAGFEFFDSVPRLELLCA